MCVWVFFVPTQHTDDPGLGTNTPGRCGVVRGCTLDALEQFAFAKLNPDQHVQHGDQCHRADEEQEAGHLERVGKVFIFDLQMQMRL